MKRALLLTYYVPPRAAIATVRSAQLLSRLPEFGWEVVPVTPDLGDTRYGEEVYTTTVTDFKLPFRRLLGVRKGQTTQAGLRVAQEKGNPERPSARTTSRSLKQRAVVFGYNVSEFANTRFGWLGPGTRAVRKLLASQHFDAIISTSPPAATHIVAERVHGTIPWIADLRDPWYRNDEMVFPEPLASLDRFLEPRVFRTASALTIVSEPLAQELRARYPAKAVVSIPNAFSASDWQNVRFEAPTRATFIHPGQLYEGVRDPRPFLLALASLLHDGIVSPDEISVQFYGKQNAWLAKEISQLGLTGVVELRGNLSRQEILCLERQATRLLLFLWDGPNERGTYTGKLFEYLGARRKILAVGGPADMVLDDALQQTGAGARYRDERSIRTAILDAVEEWRRGEAPIISEDAVAGFESRHLAQRFAEVLDAATMGPGDANPPPPSPDCARTGTPAP